MLRNHTKSNIQDLLKLDTQKIFESEVLIPLNHCVDDKQPLKHLEVKNVLFSSSLWSSTNTFERNKTTIPIAP